jgi:hypothetical protein
METELPTIQDIKELTDFLPKLYSEGFSPIDKWIGGNKDKDGKFVFPHPFYNRVVEEFIQLASEKCWSDYSYNPKQAGQMLEDEDFVKSASLPQIKTMLTYCVRGERFCDGHWNVMINNGYIRLLLERLIILSAGK